MDKTQLNKDDCNYDNEQIKTVCELKVQIDKIMKKKDIINDDTFDKYEKDILYRILQKCYAESVEERYKDYNEIIVDLKKLKHCNKYINKNVKHCKDCCKEIQMQYSKCYKCRFQK